METPESMGILSKTIIEPETKWKDESYYIVDVAFTKNNVIHREIFFTGFINSSGAGNSLGRFSRLDKHETINDVYYLKAIREIDINQQL